jgi:hypothetical protein
MRLFKKPPSKPDPHRRDESQLRESMTAMTERRRQKHPKAFSVLNLAPQLLGDEQLGRPEMQLATSVLSERLRGDDTYCALDDGSLVVLLPHTTDDDAAIVAHRLAQDLVTRSSSIRRRNWQVGVAAYPRDARTQGALIELARAAARRSSAA